jgi:ligand-binding sensor domain-containing protein
MILTGRLDQVIYKLFCRPMYLLAGFLLWIGSAFAQMPPVRFEGLSVKDGLSSNNVRSILQDRHGFMWFGTYGGLNRFDGYAFKVYKYSSQDTTSIGGNHVIDLWEDPNGIIWLAISGGGLARLDPRTDSIRRYTSDLLRPGKLHAKTVTAIRGDRFGNMWIGTTEGLYHFNPETEIFTPCRQISDDPGDIGSMVSAIHEDRNGVIWVGTLSGGLSRINLKKGQNGISPDITSTNYRRIPGDTASLISNQVTAIGEDHSGALWIGTRAGLDRFDSRTGRCTNHFVNNSTNATTISSNHISRHGISEDKLGNLWVGTNNGLNRLDIKNLQFTRFYQDIQVSNGLTTSDIHTVYTDRTGILWLGTNDAGVCRIDPVRRQLPFFSGQPGNAISFKGYNIRSICGDTSGRLWIGTEGNGLFSYQIKTGKLKNYRETGKINGLTTNFIGSLLADHKGNIWIGPGSDWTSSKGDFSRLNLATGEIKRLPLFKSGETYAFVMSLLEDKKGHIWLGTGHAGLIRYDPEKNIMIRYSYNAYNPKILSDSWVRALAEDHQGIIWIGTGYGLNRLDPGTGRFEHFFNDLKNIKTLPHNEIHSLCISRNGKLWVGTDGGGLCLFNPVTRQFTTFNEKDGLPDNAVHNILEDDDGNLWLNTNRGLCLFSPTTRQFTNFNLDDQQGNFLISGNVSTGACFKGLDGTLYFGGKNGFIYFHPHDLRLNRQVPPVVLTGVRVFDKLLQGYHGGQTITLNHEQNSLTLEFAALNYTSTGKNQYAYQLVNLDPDWVYSGTRRSVTYTNLDPGTYAFRVKGSNNDGLWNDTGTFLTIVIQPAWWQTIWFTILLIIAIAAIVYALYRYRLAQFRQHQILRDQIARDLHDDVGGVLSGISFYSEAASAMYREGHFQDSYYLLQKIADNARTTIERMSDVVWSMRSDTNNALKLAERLESFGRELLVHRGVGLIVETEETLAKFPLSADVLRNLYLIGKEALHNAAKHSGATEVKLSIQQIRGKVSLTVQDNGRGFTDSGKGNGLDSMMRRAEAIGATYHLDTNPDQGTGIHVAC